MRRRDHQRVGAFGSDWNWRIVTFLDGGDMIDRRRKDDQQYSAQPDRQEGELAMPLTSHAIPLITGTITAQL